MSDDASVAVENPPAVEVPPKRKERPADARPKPQPPCAVVLFNDEEHTFQYVIETLMKASAKDSWSDLSSRASRSRQPAMCALRNAAWTTSPWLLPACQAAMSKDAIRLPSSSTRLTSEGTKPNVTDCSLPSPSALKSLTPRAEWSINMVVT